MHRRPSRSALVASLALVVAACAGGHVDAAGRHGAPRRPRLAPESDTDTAADWAVGPSSFGAL